MLTTPHAYIQCITNEIEQTMYYTDQLLPNQDDSCGGTIGQDIDKFSSQPA